MRSRADHCLRFIAALAGLEDAAAPCSVLGGVNPTHEGCGTAVPGGGETGGCDGGCDGGDDGGEGALRWAVAMVISRSHGFGSAVSGRQRGAESPRRFAPLCSRYLIRGYAATRGVQCVMN